MIFYTLTVSSIKLSEGLHMYRKAWDTQRKSTTRIRFFAEGAVMPPTGAKGMFCPKGVTSQNMRFQNIRQTVGCKTAGFFRTVAIEKNLIDFSEGTGTYNKIISRKKKNLKTVGRKYSASSFLLKRFLTTKAISAKICPVSCFLLDNCMSKYNHSVSKQIQMGSLNRYPKRLPNSDEKSKTCGLRIRKFSCTPKGLGLYLNYFPVNSYFSTDSSVCRVFRTRKRGAEDFKTYEGTFFFAGTAPKGPLGAKEGLSRVDTALAPKVSGGASLKKKGDSFSSQKSFWNQTFDKGRLKNFVLWFLLKHGEYKTVKLVEELKTLGFEYATKAGISLGIEDLKIPKKKNILIMEAEQLSISTIKQYKRSEITGVERFQRLIDTWHRTSERLKQEVIDNFERLATDILNPVYMMAFSGARGNISQVRQLVGMRGLMSNPQGQIIDFPIRSNFREGLTLTEYIISSYGARKGIVDTALRTANAGYLTRRLVDVAQHVIISNFDCGTRRGIFLTDMKEGNKTIYSLQNRLIGRVLARDIFKSDPRGNSLPQRGPLGESSKLKIDLGRLAANSANTRQSIIKIASRNVEISSDLSISLASICKKVFVRSALTCQTKNLVCQLCYGWSLAQGNLVGIGEAVGVVAAQSIGEPGTQLTMRTFHTGGVFSGDVSDQIRAPFNGIVIYDNPIAGTLIRTPEGKIGFLTKNEGSFTVFPKVDASLPTVSQKHTILSDSFDMPPKDSGAKGRLSETADFTIGTSIYKRSSHKESGKKFKIPFYTLLFFKNGEKVIEKEVIAQISSINRQKNATDQAEFTINAELSGQFFSKFLNLKENKVGPKLKGSAKNKPSILKEKIFATGDSSENHSQVACLRENIVDTIFESWGWGYAWVLSGKIYQLPLSSTFFPIIGDFVNHKTYMNKNKLSLPSNFGTSLKLSIPLPNSIGHNVFFNKGFPNIKKMRTQHLKVDTTDSLSDVLKSQQDRPFGAKHTLGMPGECFARLCSDFKTLEIAAPRNILSNFPLFFLKEGLPRAVSALDSFAGTAEKKRRGPLGQSARSNFLKFNSKSLIIKKNFKTSSARMISSDLKLKTSLLNSLNYSQKDFTILKTELISFQLSKITYQKLGYFLKLAPISMKIGNKIDLIQSSNQLSILSDDDTLFLFSSLATVRNGIPPFGGGRLSKEINQEENRVKFKKNKFEYPANWSASFAPEGCSIFLNWFPKRFSTKTGGLILIEPIFLKSKTVERTSQKVNFISPDSRVFRSQRRPEGAEGLPKHSEISRQTKGGQTKGSIRRGSLAKHLISPEVPSPCIQRGAKHPISQKNNARILKKDEWLSTYDNFSVLTKGQENLDSEAVLNSVCSTETIQTGSDSSSGFFKNDLFSMKQNSSFICFKKEDFAKKNSRIRIFFRQKHSKRLLQDLPHENNLINFLKIPQSLQNNSNIINKYNFKKRRGILSLKTSKLFPKTSLKCGTKESNSPFESLQAKFFPTFLKRDLIIRQETKNKLNNLKGTFSAAKNRNLQNKNIRETVGWLNKRLSGNKNISTEIFMPRFRQSLQLQKFIGSSLSFEDQMKDPTQYLKNSRVFLNKHTSLIPNVKYGLNWKNSFKFNYNSKKFDLLSYKNKISSDVQLMDNKNIDFKSKKIGSLNLERIFWIPQSFYTFSVGKLSFLSDKVNSNYTNSFIHNSNDLINSANIDILKLRRKTEESDSSIGCFAEGTFGEIAAKSPLWGEGTEDFARPPLWGGEIAARSPLHMHGKGTAACGEIFAGTFDASLPDTSAPKVKKKLRKRIQQSKLSKFFGEIWVSNFESQISPKIFQLNRQGKIKDFDLGKGYFQTVDSSVKNNSNHFLKNSSVLKSKSSQRSRFFSNISPESPLNISVKSSLFKSNFSPCPLGGQAPTWLFKNLSDSNKDIISTCIFGTNYENLNRHFTFIKNLSDINFKNNRISGSKQTISADSRDFRPEGAACHEVKSDVLPPKLSGGPSVQDRPFVCMAKAQKSNRFGLWNTLDSRNLLKKLRKRKKFLFDLNFIYSSKDPLRKSRDSFKKEYHEMPATQKTLKNFSKIISFPYFLNKESSFFLGLPSNNLSRNRVFCPKGDLWSKVAAESSQNKPRRSNPTANSFGSLEASQIRNRLASKFGIDWLSKRLPDTSSRRGFQNYQALLRNPSRKIKFKSSLPVLILNNKSQMSLFNLNFYNFFNKAFRQVKRLNNSQGTSILKPPLAAPLTKKSDSLSTQICSPYLKNQLQCLFSLVGTIKARRRSANSSVKNPILKSDVSKSCAVISRVTRLATRNFRQAEELPVAKKIQNKKTVANNRLKTFKILGLNNLLSNSSFLYSKINFIYKKGFFYFILKNRIFGYKGAEDFEIGCFAPETFGGTFGPRSPLCMHGEGTSGEIGCFAPETFGGTFGPRPPLWGKGTAPKGRQNSRKTLGESLPTVLKNSGAKQTDSLELSKSLQDHPFESLVSSYVLKSDVSPQRGDLAKHPIELSKHTAESRDKRPDFEAHLSAATSTNYSFSSINENILSGLYTQRIIDQRKKNLQFWLKKSKFLKKKYFKSILNCSASKRLYSYLFQGAAKISRNLKTHPKASSFKNMPRLASMQQFSSQQIIPLKMQSANFKTSTILPKVLKVPKSQQKNYWKAKISDLRPQTQQSLKKNCRDYRILDSHWEKPMDFVIKPGWPYFTNNISNYILDNKKLIQPGKVIGNELIFDRESIFLEIISFEESEAISLLTLNDNCSQIFAKSYFPYKPSTLLLNLNLPQNFRGPFFFFAGTAKESRAEAALDSLKKKGESLDSERKIFGFSWAAPLGEKPQTRNRFKTSGRQDPLNYLDFGKTSKASCLKVEECHQAIFIQEKSYFWVTKSVIKNKKARFESSYVNIEKSNNLKNEGESSEDSFIKKSIGRLGAPKGPTEQSTRSLKKFFILFRSASEYKFLKDSEYKKEINKIANKKINAPISLYRNALKVNFEIGCFARFGKDFGCFAPKGWGLKNPTDFSGISEKKIVVKTANKLRRFGSKIRIIPEEFASNTSFNTVNLFSQFKTELLNKQKITSQTISKFPASSFQVFSNSSFYSSFVMLKQKFLNNYLKETILHSDNPFPINLESKNTKFVSNKQISINVIKPIKASGTVPLKNNFADVFIKKSVFKLKEQSIPIYKESPITAISSINLSPLIISSKIPYAFDFLFKIPMRFFCEQSNLKLIFKPKTEDFGETEEFGRLGKIPKVPFRAKSTDFGFETDGSLEPGNIFESLPETEEKTKTYGNLGFKNNNNFIHNLGLNNLSHSLKTRGTFKVHPIKKFLNNYLFKIQNLKRFKELNIIGSLSKTSLRKTTEVIFPLTNIKTINKKNFIDILNLYKVTSILPSFFYCPLAEYSLGTNLEKTLLEGFPNNFSTNFRDNRIQNMNLTTMLDPYCKSNVNNVYNKTFLTKKYSFSLSNRKIGFVRTVGSLNNFLDFRSKYRINKEIFYYKTEFESFRNNKILSNGCATDSFINTYTYCSFEGEFIFVSGGKPFQLLSTGPKNQHAWKKISRDISSLPSVFERLNNPEGLPREESDSLSKTDGSLRLSSKISKGLRPFEKIIAKQPKSLGFLSPLQIRPGNLATGTAPKGRQNIRKTEESGRLAPNVPAKISPDSRDFRSRDSAVPSEKHPKELLKEYHVEVKKKHMTKQLKLSKQSEIPVANRKLEIVDQDIHDLQNALFVNKHLIDSCLILTKKDQISYYLKNINDKFSGYQIFKKPEENKELFIEKNPKPEEFPDGWSKKSDFFNQNSSSKISDFKTSEIFGAFAPKGRSWTEGPPESFGGKTSDFNTSGKNFEEIIQNVSMNTNGLKFDEKYYAPLFLKRVPNCSQLFEEGKKRQGHLKDWDLRREEEYGALYNQIIPKNFQTKNKYLNYKQIYFALENLKKKNQYLINDTVIKFLNILGSPEDSNLFLLPTKIKSEKGSFQSFESGISPNNFSKNTEDSTVSPKADDNPAGTLISRCPSGESEKSERLSMEFNLKINKVPMGMSHQTNRLLLGELLVYGDQISSHFSITKPGQIIHVNSNKVTIRKGQSIFVSPKAILHKYDTDFIEEQSPVITLSYQQLKTGDIIEGIPKVEQFFEARTTKRGRLFRDSLSNLLKGLFKRYCSKGHPLDQAVRQSFYKIQQIIVDGVQRVYRSQGVSIADKHLEVIVKQMTSKVRIIEGGQTGFFPGEIVDLNVVEEVNSLLMRKISYEPLVLGITKASLEVDSFLSAASFQQTTRVLSNAAISKKKDFLKGLKENVILGNLIPAGTGYLVYLIP